MNQLATLNQKLQQHAKPGSDAYKKGLQLYADLLNAQETFFDDLIIPKNASLIQSNLTLFLKACEDHVKEADKIMGHGWLYRALEVLIKAVGALVGGAIMAIGVIGLQGFASAEHRKQYNQTFFTWNETDSSKALKGVKTALDDVKHDIESIDSGKDSGIPKP